MTRTEETELTVLCLVHDSDRYLLQNRVSKDWKGYTLPGGHVEIGESIVDAVVREVREETGLTIHNPSLCGVKQFPLKDGDYKKGRYIVFLFETDQYEGEIISSDEGTMHWVNKSKLDEVELVEDFYDLIEVMESKNLNEFQYAIDNGKWTILKK